ncbi:chemokine (C-C motif) ligand 33, duplicate 3 isoform X2 [Ctenopharyngodon idella]|uniref:Chemokine ligand 33 n=1 Tax=Ctenopharyngodon idella TaxID=7959 RepID=A0A345D741_CTEID|nr:chemokine (C-C motif) ligand 33, duplicate 3 isoform X2 [Ctenopharyngodon idella]AXF84171.1 chemokine ligand 33 [Ctenopharyngodon idella]
MRASSLCMVFGLVLLMAWTSEAQLAAGVIPEMCCFDFIGFQIPDSKVVKAVRTHSSCPAAGVVVTTQKNHKFCVKPDEAWIKKLLEK